MIIPTSTIIITPIIVRALPPPIPNDSTNCIAAGLDCAALPPPKEAPTHRKAKIPASTLPKFA